jgi:hypothetical protein
MSEAIVPLSDDERTVLMIAVEGSSMIAIGRWKEPILALTRRGFMRKVDEVNYVITEAGRAASEVAEDDAIRDYLKIGRKFGG